MIVFEHRESRSESVTTQPGSDFETKSNSRNESEVNLKVSKQTSDQYFVPTINNNPVIQIDDREKSHCDSGAEATLAHEQSSGS